MLVLYRRHHLTTSVLVEAIVIGRWRFRSRYLSHKTQVARHALAFGSRVNNPAPAL